MTLYRAHEAAKKREYGERVREVEKGVFTPLVFSSTGGMARECTTFFKRLADLLSVLPYSQVLCWIRCRLSFALLRSAIMAVRRSRSLKPTSYSNDILIACTEAAMYDHV